MSLVNERSDSATHSECDSKPAALHPLDAGRMTEYASQYVVARFLQNPLREEAKNIGIVLQCRQLRYVGGRFEEDLDRISIRPSDRAVILHYADWAVTLSEATSSGDSMFVDRELEPDFLPRLSATPMGTIQFTEPRGCVTSNPEQTLHELYAMLVMPEESELDTKTKASEKSVAQG